MEDAEDKPAVKDFVDSAQDALAFPRRNGYSIDLVPVEVVQRTVEAAQALQLLNTAHTHDLFIVIADPQGDGCPPVSVPGDIPVVGVCDPVGEPLLLDKRRNPVCPLKVLEHVWDAVGHADEP